MPVEHRKIFISWSKSPTDRIATELARFLKHMFDNVRPFVSKDNVAFGSLSIGEIHRQLAGTSFGILIVTRGNQHEPWLNFEAGSLAKTIPDDSDARVVPLLIDHESTAQLTGPIANLQAVMADEEGVRRLMSDLADTLGVDAAVFGTRWPAGWSRLEGALNEARAEIAAGPAAPERTPDDMLQEIVTLLRARPSTPQQRVFPVDEPKSYQIDIAMDIYNLLSEIDVPANSVQFGAENGVSTVTIVLENKPTQELRKKILSRLKELVPNHRIILEVGA